MASAQGIRTQAGLIPNPEFQFQNENLRPGQTYARDVDTLALINQPLDILGKRKQRVAVANEGVIRTQAEYDLARWQLVQRVKLYTGPRSGRKRFTTSFRGPSRIFRRSLTTMPHS